MRFARIAFLGGPRGSLEESAGKSREQPHIEFTFGASYAQRRRFTTAVRSMDLILPYAIIAGAYLIGALPFGWLIARAKGVDIFAHGSGNIGATNVGRVLGRKFGLLVFALDYIKGAAPVAVAIGCRGLLGGTFRRQLWLGVGPG